MTALVWVSAVLVAVLAVVFWGWFAGWTVRSVAGPVLKRSRLRRMLRFSLYAAMVCRANEVNYPDDWGGESARYLDDARRCAEALSVDRGYADIGRGLFWPLSRPPALPVADQGQGSHHG